MGELMIELTESMVTYYRD